MASMLRTTTRVGAYRLDLDMTFLHRRPAVVARDFDDENGRPVPDSFLTAPRRTGDGMDGPTPPVG